jgi:hypothetical protein
MSATSVKSPALICPTRSPKLRRPTARPPRMTVKLSHERKVRSLAKKTLGSTRVGRAMRLPGGVAVRCWSQRVVRALRTYPERFGGEVGWTWLCLWRLWWLALDAVLLRRSWSWRRGRGGPMVEIWSNKLLGLWLLPIFRFAGRNIALSQCQPH